MVFVKMIQKYQQNWDLRGVLLIFSNPPTSLALKSPFYRLHCKDKFLKNPWNHLTYLIIQRTHQWFKSSKSLSILCFSEGQVLSYKWNTVCLYFCILSALKIVSVTRLKVWHLSTYEKVKLLCLLTIIYSKAAEMNTHELL